MLTLPRIVERDAQPYVAIRREVTLPFEAVIREVVPAIFGWLGAHGVAPAGPLFFNYRVVDMPRLEVEFGVPTQALVEGDDQVVAGMLPGGRYATLTYWGHYENLMDANAVLVGWAKQRGIAWDSRQTPRGDEFACRLEIYETDPEAEPDPEKWETVLAFKIAD